MGDAGKAATNSGVGFLGLLTLLFIGLKLGHVIAWSWVWVLSPLWGFVAVLIGVFLVVLLVAAAVRSVSRGRRLRRNAPPPWARVKP